MAFCLGFTRRQSSNYLHDHSVRYHRPSDALDNLFVKAVGGPLYVLVSISALIFLSAWTFNYWVIA